MYNVFTTSQLFYIIKSKVFTMNLLNATNSKISTVITRKLYEVLNKQLHYKGIKFFITWNGSVYTAQLLCLLFIGWTVQSHDLSLKADFLFHCFLVITISLQPDIVDFRCFHINYYTSNSQCVNIKGLLHHQIA